MSDTGGVIVTAHNKYGNLTIYRNNRSNAENLAKIISNLTYEIEVTKIIDKEDYDLFIDVGASFGYYTRIAASKASVFAFEPHPIVYGFLKWNTRDLPHVEISDKFVGNKTDAFIPEDKVSSMIGTRGGIRTRSFDVETIKLDDVLWTTPDYFNSILIKIDVEGFELNVLNSGSNLLTAPNIKWIVELHPWATTQKQLLDVFTGYKHRILTPGTKSTVYYFEREDA